MQSIANILGVQQLAAALYNLTLGSSTMGLLMEEVAQAGAGGLRDVANRRFEADFRSREPIVIAQLVAGNLGLSGPAKDGAIVALENLLASTPTRQRGAALLDALDFFSTLGSDLTFGAPARDWNARMVSAVQYSGVIDVAGKPPGLSLPTSYKLTVAQASAEEGKAVNFQINIDPAPASTSLRIDYRTLPNSATTDDFASASGALVFPLGISTQSLSIGTVQDLEFEFTEKFTVEFAGPKLASAVRADGFILDNDTDPISQGQFLELTEAPDLLFGRAGNDVFIAKRAGKDNRSNTLNEGDELDGGAGTDLLSVQFDDTDTIVFADEASDMPTTIRSIEVINVRSTKEGKIATVDVSGVADIQEINADRGLGELMILNLPTDASVGVIGNGSLSSGPVKFRYADPEAEVILKLMDGTRGVNLSNQPLGITQTESATIISSGAPNQTGILNLDENTEPGLAELIVKAESDLAVTLEPGDFILAGANLTVTGDGRVDLGRNGIFKSIDATGNRGGLAVGLSKQTTALKGSAGNDEIITATINPALSSIDAGAGLDRLVVSAQADFATPALRSVYKNFEILANASGALIDVEPEKSISGIRSLEVASDGGGFGKLTEGLASNVSVFVNQTKPLKFALGAATTGSSGSTGTASTTTASTPARIELFLGRGSGAAPAVDFLGAGSLDITGFNALTLVANPGPLSSANSADRTSTISAITAPTLKTIYLAGTAFEFVQAFAPSAAVSIDATALTGDDSGTGSTAKGLMFLGTLPSGSTLRGSFLSDTLTVTNTGSSWTAQDGNDYFRSATISAVATAKQIDGGLGVDTLELGDAGTSGKLVVKNTDFANASSIERLIFSKASEVVFEKDSLNNLVRTSGSQIPELSIAFSPTGDSVAESRPIKADLSALTNLNRIFVETGKGADTIIAPATASISRSLKGGEGADTIVGGPGVDVFVMDSNGSVYYSSQSWDQIRGYEPGIDVISFNVSSTVPDADLTLPVAGENVQTNPQGLIIFDAADRTLQQRFKAIQYDVQLDRAGLVAFFHDSGSTFVYFSGSNEGNSDDQFIQLTGVLAQQLAGGQTVVAY